MQNATSSQYNEVKFLDLNATARASALQQIAKIHEQEKLYDATTPEYFAEMIVDGYNPDRDFMFLQYSSESVNEVTVYFKDFS